MSKGESLERLEPYFEHTGSLTWECQVCRADGIQPFQITTRGYENPRSGDYDDVLSRAEAEHAVVCNGRLISVCAGRSKMVRFDCHAQLIKWNWRIGFFHTLKKLWDRLLACKYCGKNCAGCHDPPF